MGSLGVAGTYPAFVSAGLVEDGKEGLAFLALAVMGLPGGLIPYRSKVVLYIVVGFGIVGAVIAGFPQEFGIELQPLGPGCL